MPDDLTIRPAVAADADAICLIYNQGIEDRVATLETQRRTAEERRAWLAARGPRQPALVAEAGGEVVAWASLDACNPRPAFEHVADVSVYVRRDRRGRGLGRALLAALDGEARRHGYHKLVLAMFPWNEGALGLYRRHGFRDVGTYREQGRLDGRWVDVHVMEKLLE